MNRPVLQLKQYFGPDWMGLIMCGLICAMSFTLVSALIGSAITKDDNPSSEWFISGAASGFIFGAFISNWYEIKNNWNFWKINRNRENQYAIDLVRYNEESKQQEFNSFISGCRK